MLFNSLPSLAQSNFSWPDTPAAKVFQAFVKAYNSGSAATVAAFVKAHYLKTDLASVNSKTQRWMDIYQRFGRIDVHALSINKPLDLEVWVQGQISKTWFAPEFILDKNSKKVRAVGLLLGAQPDGVATPASSHNQLMARVKRYLDVNQKNGLFQGSVLIQHQGKVLLERGYGFKNIEKQQSNRADTPIRLASITKVVTAIAALQLVQSGVLDLNAPISKYLKDMPSHIAEKITIYQILTHTSGYELDGIDGFRQALEKTRSMSEVYATQLAYLPKWPSYQSFKRARKYDYANDSYDLLAIIIEKVSAETFPGYIKKHIIDVADMPNTSFSTANIATPYRFDLTHGGLKDHESVYPTSWGHISGAAALKSTVSDLRNLFNTLNNGESLLSKAHKNLLFAPLVKKGGPEYQSLGLNISFEQVLNYGHGGVSVGGSTQLRYFPHSDYLLIVLCNNRSGASNFYHFFKNNLPGKPI